MSQPTEQTENPTGWTPHLCGPARPTADMAGAEERSSQLCGPRGEDPGQAPGPGGWAVARKLEGAGLCPTWVGQGAQGTSSWVAFCPLWHGPQGVAGGTPPGLHQKLCQSRPGPPWSSGAAGGTWEGPGHPGGEAWPRGAFREAGPRNRPQIKPSVVAAAVWPGAPNLLIQMGRNSGCTGVCGHTKLDPPAPWGHGRWCRSPRACLCPFAVQTGSCAPEREPCPGSPRPLPQSESWAQASDPGLPPWVPRWWWEEGRGGRRARPPAAGR